MLKDVSLNVAREYSFQFNGRIHQTFEWDNGPRLIRMNKYRDRRGYFMETWNEELFMAMSMETVWPQDNLSFSCAGALRGMHIQKNNPQGKLIHCVAGKIQDIAIDLRPGPQFGRTYTFILAQDEFYDDLLFVPQGFGHGFFAIESSIVHYKCTSLYDKDTDGGINPLECGANWIKPLKGEYLISQKDLSLPSLVDYKQD